MDRYIWPLTVLVTALVLAAGGVTAALVLRPAAPHPAPSPAPSRSAAATRATPPHPTPSPVATAHSGAASPTTAPPTATVVYRVCTDPTGTCAGTMKVEPGSILVSGDGSGFIKDVTWTHWGTASALGHGRLEIDNCQPNCAQGTYHGYAATVDLSYPKPYQGGRAYSYMVVGAPGAHYGQAFSKLVP